MLKHSRVSSTLDVSRVANAVRSPGIDTRTWVSLAIVTAVHTDGDEGVFVDVILMPSLSTTTARVGSAYSGPGFGFYFPLEIDDEVLVEAPNGDPDQGLVIVSRLDSASDPPPPELLANPEDLLLVVKSATTLRIITAGGGHVILEARDDGKVKLGNEAATLGVARLGDSIAINSVTLQTNLDARYAVANPLVPLVGVTGAITSASTKVEAE